MNIMYMCVSERKREIGIKRAIGATAKDILIEFLLESVMVTFIAGLLGVSFGIIINKILGIILPFKPVMTFWNFVIAISISISIGVIFGIVPVSKAADLNPIKAMNK